MARIARSAILLSVSAIPLIDIVGQRVPALAAIGERLRHRRLRRQAAQGVVDRAAERVDLRPSLLLSVRSAI